MRYPDSKTKRRQTGGQKNIIEHRQNYGTKNRSVFADTDYMRCPDSQTTDRLTEEYNSPLAELQD